MMTPPQSAMPQHQLNETAALARSTPPGSLVEIGVWKGGSAWYLSQVAQEQGRTLHLYDTFTGIPVKGTDDKHNIGDFGDTSLADVQAAVPNAVYHVGLFPTTLTDDIQQIAMIHCDCDQCESIKAVIDLLWPRMIEGGVVCFDDMNQDGGRKLIQHAFGDQLQESCGVWYVRKTPESFVRIA